MDERAFSDLLAANAQIAYRVAVVITGNAVEAEDAVQEAFVKAWRALGRFRDGEPFRPWLLAIVANEARNRRRTAGRRARLALSIAAEQTSAGESVDTRGLLDAVHALPEDAQLVIACRYLLGLSERETADVLAVPPGTVKSRTARALDRLREIYD